MQTQVHQEKGEEQSYQHPFWDFWFFFKQNPGACLGLGVIVVFTAIALFAPWLAPHDPRGDF